MKIFAYILLNCNINNNCIISLKFIEIKEIFKCQKLLRKSKRSTRKIG